MREFARLFLLGLFLLLPGCGNHSRANGKQVVPAAWVEAAVKPFPDESKAPAGPYNYGFQWWTVKGTKAFTALGLQGQFMYADPSTRTVIVKLSYFPPGDPKVGEEALAFLKAASLWKPQ